MRTQPSCSVILQKKKIDIAVILPFVYMHTFDIYAFYLFIFVVLIFSTSYSIHQASLPSPTHRNLILARCVASLAVHRGCVNGVALCLLPLLPIFVTLTATPLRIVKSSVFYFLSPLPVNESVSLCLSFVPLLL